MLANTEAINKQYELYKQNKALKDQEQKLLDQERQQRQKDAQTRIKASYHKHITREQTVCSHCGVTIHKGEVNYVHTNMTMTGHDSFHFSNKRFCQSCKKELCGEA